MSAEFDWQGYHPILASDWTYENVMAAEYLQCQNCDFIGNPKEFETGGESYWICPSCRSDDIVIVDPIHFYLTSEQIAAQIEWQEQIKAKGVVKAFADLGILQKPKAADEEA